MYITYKFKLQPTKSQHEKLQAALEEQRQLYNSALQERIECYRKTGASKTKFDQFTSLKEIDLIGPVAMSRWTLSRLDNAYSSFFKRLKTKQKTGFPRFRSFTRWKSIGFTEMAGIRLRGS